MNDARNPFVVSPELDEGLNHERRANKPGLGPAAELLFGIAQKVTKKASPGTPLHPPVLATGGTRTNRPMARKSARGGLMVRVYDRPLLRSSARADGALRSNIDRFAMRLREPGCEHPGYATGESNAGVTVSRSDQASVRRDPRVFDPEERSNRRSKTKTMSPLRAVSAPSGDLFLSRLLRAPQEKGEYWGRLLLVTFLGEARKVTGPARPRSALVMPDAVVKRNWPRVATERAVRAGALPC